MLSLTSVLVAVLVAQTCTEKVKTGNPNCAADLQCRNEREACRFLAIEAENEIEDRRRHGRPKLEPTSGDVQPARPASRAGTSCVTGTSSPSVETVGTGSACVQATGAERGTQSAVSVTLNPLGLATLDNPQAFARAARLTDLTLLLPVSTATSGTLPGFVGLRASFDVAGIANGRAAYSRITGAYDAALQKAGALTDRLLAVLLDEPTSACIDSVAAADEAAIEKECRVEVATQAQQVVAAREEVRRHLATVRREVDNRHGGLHLEADLPLKDIDQQQVPLRLAGEAQGTIRSTAPGWRWGVSGGLGASYVKPKDQQGATAFTWHLGGTANASVEDADVHASFGFSGNVGKLLDETNLPVLNGLTGHFVDLQAVVTVPLTAGAGVTATVSWPISRDNARHGATFSISFDGAYLLGGGAAKMIGM